MICAIPGHRLKWAVSRQAIARDWPTVTWEEIDSLAYAFDEELHSLERARLDASLAVREWESLIDGYAQG